MLKGRENVKKNKSILLLLFVFVIALTIGCSNDTSSAEGGNIGDSGVDTSGEVVDDDESETPEEDIVYKDFSDDDVTLKVATPWGEGYFMSRFGDYVEENYPHFTLEHIDWDGSVEHLEEYYAQGVIPDVFLSFSGQYVLEELDSDFGLDEMIEEYGIDLSHIQPHILEEVRSRDKEGRLVGMPQEVGAIALFYNKTIFDLFGVDYPDPNDSMSWQELFALSEKLTGELNGTNYYGLDLATINAALWELSANSTDPETGEVLIMSDPKYTKFLDLIQQYHNLPGNDGEDKDFYSGNTAMMVGWHGFLHQTLGYEEIEEQIKAKEPFDLAPIPSWEDQPGIGPSPRGVQPWAVNNHSEQKEAAFQFAVIGASEEYQMELARIGTPSILQTTESIEEYGIENELYHGKNLEALFALEPASPEIKSRWDQFVDLKLDNFKESGLDVQEHLRITQEESELKIQDAMAQESQ